MRLLLDTQALLWWLADDKRLGNKARGLIAQALLEDLQVVSSDRIFARYEVAVIDARK